MEPPAKKQMLSAENPCSICLSDIAVTDGMILPCGHVLHSECVKALRESNKSPLCPLCRQTLRIFKEDDQENIWWLTKFAQTCNVEHQHTIAMEFLRMKRFSEAYFWFTRAAEKNHAKSSYQLGQMFFEGNGVAKNNETAFSWFLKSAEEGDHESQFKVAEWYEVGLHVEKNEEKAFFIYKKLADANKEIAFLKVGECYEFGRGVEKDESIAIEWYQKGVTRKVQGCSFRIVRCVYEKHSSLQKIEANAFYVLTLHAESGDREAQYYLGIEILKFRQDIGVNLRKSEEWFQKAANQGHAKARHLIEHVKKQGGKITKEALLAQVVEIEK
jgi:TPR repeat protein